MASARTSIDVTVRATREGDDQGITRLAMLAFIRNLDGPWNGTDPGRWVRYRGHTFTRRPYPVGYSTGCALSVMFADHDGHTSAEEFVITANAVQRLGEIDDLLDIVFAQYPLETDEQQDDDGIATYTTVEGTVIDDILAAGVMVERLEHRIRRVHDVVKAGGSLDEIESVLHGDAASRAEREQWARDDEVEGKAIARAAEPDIEDDAR